MTSYGIKASNLFRKSMFVCTNFQKLEGSLPGHNLPKAIGEVRAVYFNNPGTLEDALIFATNGIWHLGPREAQHIPYTAITGVTSPTGKTASQTSEIDIQLTEGKLMTLPIRGGDGRFRDYFSMMTAIQGLVRLNT
ncbi:hypothetical protein [Kordiimonas gwangyangensis]|nr:hypothetical protein [Kordiimonas gwangyangensis]